jgi:hypothetical protein
MIFMFYKQLSLGTTDFLTNTIDTDVGYDWNIGKVWY